MRLCLIILHTFMFSGTTFMFVYWDNLHVCLLGQPSCLFNGTTFMFVYWDCLPQETIRPTSDTRLDIIDSFQHNKSALTTFSSDIGTWREREIFIYILKLYFQFTFINIWTTFIHVNRDYLHL